MLILLLINYRIFAPYFDFYWFVIISMIRFIIRRINSDLLVILFNIEKWKFSELFFLSQRNPKLTRISFGNGSNCFILVNLFWWKRWECCWSLFAARHSSLSPSSRQLIQFTIAVTSLPYVVLFHILSSHSSVFLTFFLLNVDFPPTP